MSLRLSCSTIAPVSRSLGGSRAPELWSITSRSTAFEPRISTRNISTQSTYKHQKSNCLITGASRGIGRAIAVALAREGARCILVGRDSTAISETLKKCEEPRENRRHATILGDVGNLDFWMQLEKHEEMSGENGKINVLVNAAGIAESSLFVRSTLDRTTEVVQTNLLGSMYAARFAAKRMMKAKANAPSERGHILNISSLLATHGGAGSVAYATSKAGVLGLTRSLAAELGPRGIRVNAICPGYIESDMTNAMSDAARTEATAKIPAARFGTVEEVADAAVFLCGNRYANNCILNLDGGLSAV